MLWSTSSSYTLSVSLLSRIFHWKIFAQHFHIRWGDYISKRIASAARQHEMILRFHFRKLFAVFPYFRVYVVDNLKTIKSRLDAESEDTTFGNVLLLRICVNKERFDVVIVQKWRNYVPRGGFLLSVTILRWCPN